VLFALLLLSSSPLLPGYLAFLSFFLARLSQPSLPPARSPDVDSTALIAAPSGTYRACAGARGGGQEGGRRED
jgi:hypothetical protein